MKKTTRIIAMRTYENVAGKWIHNISARHKIVVEKTENGWKATEIRASKHGTILEGTKKIVTRSVVGPTMWETANRLDWIIKHQPELTIEGEM